MFDLKHTTPQLGLKYPPQLMQWPKLIHYAHLFIGVKIACSNKC
jgi:hypothetical protein